MGAAEATRRAHKKPKGWRGESLRHALAAKGVSTRLERSGRDTARFKMARYTTFFSTMSPAERPVFLMLAFSPKGMTPEEIAGKIYLAPEKRNTTHVTKLLERLEAAGWVTRRGGLWDVS